MPGVRETFRASGPSPRCTAVREKQPNSSAFRGRSASRETVARWRLGGASGIRTLGTLRCSGSRSRWDYILRWDSRCRRWTGTTGVLLSEPGQSPGKDRSGRKAPWIAQPALRMRERIAPGASRVSAAVLRAAGPNEPHNESCSGPLRLVLRVPNSTPPPDALTEPPANWLPRGRSGAERSRRLGSRHPPRPVRPAPAWSPS
jgi:hypothetical protein